MSDTTLEPSRMPRRQRTGGAEAALVVVWSASEQARLGEVLRLPNDTAETWTFGRGGPLAGESSRRLELSRERPGERVATGPVESPFLSRTQLELSIGPEGMCVANVGRPAMIVDGRAVPRATLQPGATIELDDQIAFLCVDRAMAPAPSYTSVDVAPQFGEADKLGIVGESAAAWALRDRIAFVATRDAHVLLLGQSGTGKELVAQAIHALSSRAAREPVVRSAVTLPPGLIDAELFGNVRNYPNPGVPERPGIVGEAHGSTLFLDEIGELPVEMQAHLLRVLDSGGDYQRLGEAQRRRADIRLVGATNRPVNQLKHDLAARFVLRIIVPALDRRREDIPLLCRHLLRRIVADDTRMSARLCEGGDPAKPRMSAALSLALVRHGYTTHLRELERLLWLAASTSEGDRIDLTTALRDELGLDGVSDSEARDTREITAEAVIASLKRHGGLQEKVWRELKLANRYALKRLIKKYGIRVPSGKETD